MMKAVRAGRRRLAGGFWALTAWCVVSVCSAAPLNGLDPVNWGRRPIRVFNDADGLPQNTVHAVVLDTRGRLWIGTPDGAAVSDGRGWRIVNMPGRMQSNYVRTILAAADGSMWFGTQGGDLHRLTGERWEDVLLPCSDRTTATVTALAESSSPPAIWVATRGCGVLRFSGGIWQVFGVEKGLPSNRAWAVHVSRSEGGRDETLWVGTEGGVAVFTAGSGRFEVPEGFPSASANSFQELPYRAEYSPGLGSATSGDRQEFALEMWVGTYGNGLLRYREGKWTSFTEADGLPSNFVTSLAGKTQPAGGRASPLWVGTDGGGLAAVSSEGIEVMDVDSGLSSNAVYALLAADPARGGGALWVGTRSGGLVRIRDEGWLSFRPIPESPTLPVLAVLPLERDGDAPAVWFGTDGGGLVRLQRNEWTRFDEESGSLPSDTVQCLLVSREADGRSILWAGTRHGGLASRDRGRWSVFDRRSGALPSDMVQTLAETVDGNGRRELWVGTRGGLAVLGDGRWRREAAGRVLPHQSVQALLPVDVDEGAPTLWIGTAAGVVRRRNGTYDTIDLPLHNRSVRSLALITDPGGRRELWVGTDGGGVSRLDLSLDPRDLEPLSDEGVPPLPNNVVYKILQVPSGAVFLATNRGVARLTWRSDGGGEFDIHTSSAEDGLLSGQGRTGAGAVDWRGRVWVGTVGGAAVFDPGMERDDRAGKPLILKAFSHGPEELPLPSGARLPRRHSRLVFDYALLSFFRDGDTRFRTQIEPLEKNPTDWVAASQREIGPIPAGAYTFRVWGRDYAGNVTGPEELTFRVLPPSWQTWWALGTYMVLLVGGSAGFMRVRLLAHMRREEALRNLVDARTRELRQANDLLNDLSYLDPVTGIGNRRRYEERLDLEWRRAARSGGWLSLIMIDIDFFKPYNDTYGHQQGDACLHAIAVILADGLPRAGDSVARYGGEEFAVILPLTDRAGAVNLAEHLRGRVLALSIPHQASPITPVVTISCGVATLKPTPEVPSSELTRLADESLYKAKQRGRNQTVAEHGAPRASA